MTQSTVTHPIDPKFLRQMTNLKTVIDGLTDMSSDLRNLADEAETTAAAIEMALREGKTPPKGLLLTASRISADIVNDLFKDEPSRYPDYVMHAADLLTGDTVREPNGDFVSREKASPDAEDEALSWAK